MLGLSVAGLLLVALVLLVPFATEDRRVATAIPQPPPLFLQDLVEVRPGEEACLREITINPRGEVAELKLATFGRPGIPFTLTLSGDGYRSAVRMGGTYVDNDVVALTVRPPDRPVRGQACVRNDGRVRLALYGASDRTRTGAATRVDGRLSKPNLQIAFYERERSSLASRLPEIAERMSTFRPVARWEVWVLGVLVLAGVPALLVTAALKASRGSDPSEGGRGSARGLEGVRPL